MSHHDAMVNPSPHTESEEYKDVLRTTFDTYARGWHQRMANHVYAMRYRGVEQMIAPLGVSSALDIGCGTGDYAQLFDPARVRYLGIDISEKMVAECKRLYPQHQFAVADGDAIDAPGDSVDLVLSVGVLEYLPDPVSHLRELARVTRPGGSIVATVQNGSNRSRSFDRPIRALLDSGPVKALRKALGRPVDARKVARDGSVKDSRIVHHKTTVDDMRAMATAAGVKLVESMHVSLYVLPELIPGAALVNSALSRMLSCRAGWEWLRRPTGLVLIIRFEKPRA
jgi:SAM-dependent methyltransferase